MSGLTKILETFNDETSFEVNDDLTFQEVSSSGVSMKGVLQRARIKYLRAKPVWVQGKSFSPSMITFNFCRRLKVGQLAEKTEIYYEKAAPAKQTTFDMGNVIHDMVKLWFWEVGLLKGNWFCLACDKLYEDLQSPKKCPEGHHKGFLEYREVKATSKPYKISGRIDMIVDVEGSDEIVDIKSIQNRTAKMTDRQFCFEDLDSQGPKMEHIVQVNLYMFCSGIHEGHLLYIGKNDGKIKTFAVPYDESVIKPYLDEILYLIELSEKLKKGELKVGELPEPCSRKDCPCEEILVSS